MARRACGHECFAAALENPSMNAEVKQLPRNFDGYYELCFWWEKWEKWETA